jgi:hypothetical protein
MRPSKAGILAVGLTALLPRPGATQPACPWPHGVPAEIASLTDCNGVSTGAAPEYVLLQDAHGHAEAQGKLAALLVHGFRRWNARDLFIEGAFEGWRADSTPSASDTFHERMRRGDVSAPMIAGQILGEHSVQFHGIEHPPSYKANLEVYDQLRSERAAAERELRAIRLLANGLDVASESQSDELRLLSKAVSLTMKPADFESWRAPDSSLRSPALRRVLALSRRFYELAHERSLAFIDAAERSSVRGPKVIITGGFHTKAMAEQLRLLGRSYIVFAPRLTQGYSRDAYAERLDETVSALKTGGL